MPSLAASRLKYFSGLSFSTLLLDHLVENIDCQNQPVPDVLQVLLLHQARIPQGLDDGVLDIRAGEVRPADDANDLRSCLY